MKKVFSVNCIFVFLLLFAVRQAVYAQSYLYVNTDNLVLRDRPEKVYRVLAVLHAPCKLRIESSDVGYVNNKAVNKQFYQVSINYIDHRKYHNHIGGWVDKRYVVTDKDKITFPVADKNLELDASVVMMMSTFDDHGPNSNPFNYADFRAPKYKGGVNQPPPRKRIYHKGTKGGCYYLNHKGTKVYVDKRFCK